MEMFSLSLQIQTLGTQHKSQSRFTTTCYGDLSHLVTLYSIRFAGVELCFWRLTVSNVALPELKWTKLPTVSPPSD